MEGKYTLGVDREAVLYPCNMTVGDIPEVLTY